VHFLLKLDCEIVVRSSGLLYALQRETPPPLIGDFSLNAANVLSADAFLRLGLARITPTHDLNAAQVAGLAHGIGGEKLEVVAITICRSFIPSTACSAASCQWHKLQRLRTSCEQHRVARATNNRAPGYGRRGLPQYGIRRRG
jgi:hypothetical protein